VKGRILIRIRIKVKSKIRIRNKVMMRIRNTAHKTTTQIPL
jgi:hypothetical protein